MNKQTMAFLKRGALITVLATLLIQGAGTLHKRRVAQNKQQVENATQELKQVLSELSSLRHNKFKAFNHIRDSIWNEPVQLMFKMQDSLGNEKQNALMHAIAAYEKRVMPKGTLDKYFTPTEIKNINLDLARARESRRVSGKTSFATFWGLYRQIYLDAHMNLWKVYDRKPHLQPNDNVALDAITAWGFSPDEVKYDNRGTVIDSRVKRIADLPYLVDFTIPEMQRAEQVIQTLQKREDAYGAHVLDALMAIDSAERAYQRKIDVLENRATKLSVFLTEKQH